ncbi:glycosyltransferase [Vibrio vulnificus]|nr:glycosyltransferase [Vibrio vulnificus]
MMERPLVTVYITNYNYGAFLQDAIDSVVEQDYPNIEIIIIDDGSSDSSSEILNNYIGSEKFQIIFQKNKGLARTNNIALNLAKGQYIVRLDADDKFHSSAISDLLDGFDSPNIAMVFGNWNVVDENGNVLYTYKRHDFERDVTLMDVPAHGACTMFNTEYLRSVGGYDEELRCQDGYELWFRIIDKFDVKNINKVIFDYRRHGDNLTGGEERILSTRAKILSKVARKKEVDKTTCFAFLPIRGSKVDSRSMPFNRINGKYLIDKVIRDLIDSKQFDKIVISTPDFNLQEYLKTEYFNEITVHRRSIDSAKINSGIDSIISHYLNHDGSDLAEYDFGMIIGIDRPFNKSYLIQSAIDIAKIFDVDNVIGVRHNYEILFKHTGSSLKGINYDKNSLRLERDDIYQMVRGFNVFRVKGLMTTGSIWGEVIGHVVFDQKSSFCIDSRLDLSLAEHLDKL